MESIEVGIIGAGWFGLTTAKTYLEIHPGVNLVIFETASSVGGVWSSDRLYAGLKTNNMLGSYEAPDFPMDETTFGIKPGEHVPGQVMHEYLVKYAEKYGVDRRIRFNTRVECVAEAEDLADGWILTVSSDEKTERLLVKKLILATGVNSEPFVPSLEGADTFAAPLFHSKYLLHHSNDLKQARRIAILGGAKSAWDAAYTFATAGIHVDMIIRKSGKGPVWMAPAYVTPFKKPLEKLIFTRFLTWMSPCVWGDADEFGAVRGFLQRTWLGRCVVKAFWYILGNDTKSLNGFSKHPEIKKLEPWSSALWIGAGLSILNYPTDFFDLVRDGRIKVHHADVQQLSHKTVHLSTGEAIQTDAMICATGWSPKPSVKFTPPSLAADLGVPYTYDSSAFSMPAGSPLSTKADAEIVARYPLLAKQPNLYPYAKVVSAAAKENSSIITSPYKLYRLLIPPQSPYFQRRNFGVVGAIQSLSASIVGQAQALWLIAHFDGKLSLPTNAESERTYEAELWSCWSKRRTPAGSGAYFPDVAFDTLPYIDLLLRDLGLQHRRKSGWVKELTEPYGPENYKGLVQEWLSTSTGVKEGKKGE